MRPVFPVLFAVSSLLFSQGAPQAVPGQPTPASDSLPLQNTRQAELETLLQPQRKSETGVRAAVLVTRDRDLALAGLPGCLSTTWVFFGTLYYADFEGRSAPIRCQAGALNSVMVSFELNPEGRLFLVRAKPNHHGTRFVKLGRTGLHSVTRLGHPDRDWVVPTRFREVRAGLWELMPTEALPPGEYGIFAGISAGASGGLATNGSAGELWAFGVDR